jgi:hypothetical protein
MAVKVVIVISQSVVVFMHKFELSLVELSQPHKPGHMFPFRGEANTSSLNTHSPLTFTHPLSLVHPSLSTPPRARRRQGGKEGEVIGASHQ